MYWGHLRSGIRKGNGQRLDQVAATRAHARPKREALLLRARHFWQNERGGRLSNPRLRRPQRKVWAEADRVLCVGDAEKGGQQG